MEKNLMMYSVEPGSYYREAGNITAKTEYTDIVSALLPKHWKQTRTGVYRSCIYNFDKIPMQGWKIHLSATLANAPKILEKTTELMAGQSVSFKYVIDESLLKIINSKGYSRGGSGKFITVYPENEQQFTYLLELLYDLFQEDEGSYILSDQRYKDCKVLYYRYGGLKPNFIVGTDGLLQPVILDGNKKLTADMRNAYFSLPEGIKNPIEKQEEQSGDSYLSQNYTNIEAMYFSNSGGVYKAKSKETGKTVVLKEARPYTCMEDSYIDSKFLRQKEYKMLKKFQSFGYTPEAIEIFDEWEHVFLVEEYVEGENFYTFCGENNPIYQTFGEKAQRKERFQKYFMRLLDMELLIADFLVKIHGERVVFGDLSPNNILITPSGNIKFIDLEGCIGEEDGIKYYMASRGFRKNMETKDIYNSDVYAFGCLLFHGIVRRNELIELDIGIIKANLYEIEEDYGVNKDFIDLITEILYQSKNFNMKQIYERMQNIKKQKECQGTARRTTEKGREITTLMNDVLKSIYNEVKLDEKGELIPITPLIDNQVNISTGLSGILIGLHNFGQNQRKHEMLHWMKQYCFENKLIPPGLFTGYTGVAWAALECGEWDWACEIADELKQNPLLKKCYSLGEGCAGLGIFFLKLYQCGMGEQYLKAAIETADYVVKNAKEGENQTYYWEENDDVAIGYGYGASGIGLFLLYLYEETGRKIYRECAEGAIAYDLTYMQKNDQGTDAFPRSKKNQKILYPYYLTGTAGIVEVLVRAYEILKDIRYRERAELLIKSIYIKYTVNPGLHKGLAGLALALEDCAVILNEPKYHQMALELVKGLEIFQINTEKGVFFPGDFIVKVSADYGDGSMGILLVMQKIMGMGKPFHFFFLDKTI